LLFAAKHSFSLSMVCERHTNHYKLMIRVFTIFCKLNLKKLSAETLFSAAMQEFSKDELFFLLLPCPFCKAKHPNWSYHASYKRYLISFEKGLPVAYEISITRLICSSCSHTHAILPEIIIPYGSYSLIFILSVLRDYYLANMTIRTLCDKYQISSSTLYAWKHLFLIHKKLWLGLLENISQDSLVFLSSFPSISSSLDLEIFFKSHAQSFLQGVSKTALFNSA